MGADLRKMLVWQKNLSPMSKACIGSHGASGREVSALLDDGGVRDTAIEVLIYSLN